jgi:hypothetical protein
MMSVLGNLAIVVDAPVGRCARPAPSPSHDDDVRFAWSGRRRWWRHHRSPRPLRSTGAADLTSAGAILAGAIVAPIRNS